MRKITFVLFAFLFCLCFSAKAQYTSPGQSKSWTLDSLVVNSAGAVTFSEGAYLINNDIVISLSDTLNILEAAVIRTAAAIKITVSGVIISDPASGRVIFTAIDSTASANYFKGIRIEESDLSRFKNTNIMHGGGVQLIGSDVVFENCIIRNNNNSLTSGAINFSGASPVIKYCTFKNNTRAAIGSGANIIGSPQILYNTFIHNVTDNSNRPQINIGPGDADTIRIIGNYIEGAYSVSGGIGVSNLLGSGSAKVLILNNEIRTNRYGYTQTGANISSIIQGNKIINNNLETNPMNGGSGLNFVSSAAGNTAILRGNIISGNLWGVTIQGIASPDLGTEADPGMNLIYGNGNGGLPYDLYNNTALPVSAQYNYWGTADESGIENVIVHQADNASLGLVTYLPYMPLNPEINTFKFTAIDNPGLASDVTGVIDVENHTVSVAVPAGTDVTNLIPDISIPFGATISPENGIAQDFTEDVTYTVSVPHGSQAWVVSVESAQLYSATFVVKDQDNNPVDDAIITFNGTAYEAGVYVFENLAPGSYPFIVNREGYESVEGIVGISVENITEEVTLQLISFTLTFSINDSGAAVEGASIVIAGETLNTDADGEASIVLLPGEYSYQVSKNGYETVESSVVITDQDVIESVSLELIDYLLTFIVKAQDGSALEGASVSVNFESLVTDENGVASLEVIPGSYEYIVTMADYLGVTSTVEVVDQDVTVEISLQPNGINEDIFSNFKLYPNPFSEKITLNNPWLVERVLINTMDGKLVYDILLNGNSEIKTSDLKNGIYLITLEGWNGERFMVKMVK